MIICGYPSCDVKYAINRTTTSMSFKLIDILHRHCVLIIAEQLRPFYLIGKCLLGCLFSSALSFPIKGYNEAHYQKSVPCHYFHTDVGHFRSVRIAHRHVLSKLSDTSLNVFIIHLKLIRMATAGFSSVP